MGKFTDDIQDVYTVFVDPSQVSSRLFGGPHFIKGWRSHDGERYFNFEKSIMWFSAIMGPCKREGLDYHGHRIAPDRAREG